uniref:ATP synthase complex subunit 8 n=1 Tax=Perotis lugubris TaxID=1205687 RepID=A0A0S2MPA8_9COLE|nr:ATP synthase F0 subunit 8 [Perotis lugubris]
MPQMAPMNWLSLFILFSMIFILFMIFNFYNVIYTTSQPSKTKKMFKINWKW